MSRPVAAVAADASPCAFVPTDPSTFATRKAGRNKRPLCVLLGRIGFDVSPTRLAPGTQSALRQFHNFQDEFVYILEGGPTFITGAGLTLREHGICAGFNCGDAGPRHLVNESDAEVVYFEVGDRPGVGATFPEDDIEARRADGRWWFSRKDGIVC